MTGARRPLWRKFAGKTPFVVPLTLSPPPPPHLFFFSPPLFVFCGAGICVEQVKETNAQKQQTKGKLKKDSSQETRFCACVSSYYFTGVGCILPSGAARLVD
ncbi:hypothetical protein TRSC58_07309 [Trypanosoma rangeli SC58]|uniref:Uncharacterized protein n=1 Tax=Trypanosoma rangeli SC58 TaxID=429131 RepID=A0A061IT51_TRYRA|nr:hypothetical protein TRSC58_07309 [Trypanosoma rangeli SC58]